MFKRARRPVSTRPPERTTDGALIWAVGDVHGRLDLLDTLLPAVLKDFKTSKVERSILVFLGDYVDRGPDSKGVIDRLCSLQDVRNIETHFIRGNHEDRFEAFFKSPDVGPAWAEYGGRETLRSYGVTPPTLPTDTVGWAMASHEMSAAVPVRHRRFLTGLMPSISVGDYFFTHAGVRPGVPLASQSPSDLMWIRRTFLEHTAAFDQTIVHGHTPTDLVHLDHRRIGIDTGAYASGVLTALRLQGDQRELIQTRLGAEGTRVERTTL